MSIKSLFTFRRQDSVGVLAGVAIAIGILYASPYALASCESSGTCQMVADVTIVPKITNRISMMEQRIIEALDAHIRLSLKASASSQRSLQQQMAQGAVAQVQAQAAMQAFQQQENIEGKLQDLKNIMVQPITTCLTLISGAEMPRATETVSVATATRTNSTTQRQMRTKGAAEARLRTYKDVKDKFCSPEDEQRGTCKAVTPTFQNADIRSVFLFGNDEGGETREPHQEEATSYLIARLVGEHDTPPALGNPEAERTPAGRYYEESRRDYLAYSSLIAHSLQSIRTNHSPIDGLGSSLKQAGITDEKIPDAISVSEAVSLHAKAQLSPTALKDIASAGSAEVLLRKLVTNSSFNLWTSVQTYKSLERQEALAAAHLSIDKRSTMQPKLDSAARTATKQVKTEQ